MKSTCEEDRNQNSKLYVGACMCACVYVCMCVRMYVCVSVYVCVCMCSSRSTMYFSHCRCQTWTLPCISFPARGDGLELGEVGRHSLRGPLGGHNAHLSRLQNVGSFSAVPLSFLQTEQSLSSTFRCLQNHRAEISILEENNIKNIDNRNMHMTLTFLTKMILCELLRNLDDMLPDFDGNFTECQLRFKCRHLRSL